MNVSTLNCSLDLCFLIKHVFLWQLLPGRKGVVFTAERKRAWDFSHLLHALDFIWAEPPVQYIRTVMVTVGILRNWRLVRRFRQTPFLLQSLRTSSSNVVIVVYNVVDLDHTFFFRSCSRLLSMNTMCLMEGKWCLTLGGPCLWRMNCQSLTQLFIHATVCLCSMSLICSRSVYI